MSELKNSYRLTHPPEMEPPSGHLFAMVPIAAKVVGEHFAIRPTPVPHPAGIEDMWLVDHVIDHIPSGLKAYVTSFGAMSEDDAVTMATAIGTAPVDWSVKNPDTPPEMGAFVGWAAHRIEDGKTASWSEWGETREPRSTPEPAAA